MQYQLSLPSSADSRVWPQTPSRIAESVKRPNPKRTKARVACTRCRRLRSKCDGFAPCVSCTSTHSECIYTIPPVTQVKQKEILYRGPYFLYPGLCCDSCASGIDCDDFKPCQKCLGSETECEWKGIKFDQNTEEHIFDRRLPAAGTETLEGASSLPERYQHPVSQSNHRNNRSILPATLPNDGSGTSYQPVDSQMINPQLDPDGFQVSYPTIQCLGLADHFPPDPSTGDLAPTGHSGPATLFDGSQTQYQPFHQNHDMTNWGVHQEYTSGPYGEVYRPDDTSWKDNPTDSILFDHTHAGDSFGMRPV